MPSTEPASPLSGADLPSRTAAERHCICFVFFIVGFVFSSWVPYIPRIKQRFAMTDTHLGLTLLLIGLGALLAMGGAPALMRLLRNRRTIITALVGLAATFYLILNVQALLLFYLALFAFGFFNGLYNVAINAQGSDFERAKGRSVMSAFHAFFSIGGFCGAATTYFILLWSAGETVHGALIIVLAIAAMATCYRTLPADLTPFQAAGQLPFKLNRGLGAIAVIALLALSVEGSITDWLTVYIQRAHAGALETAALGFAVFSCAMTIARLLGDRLKERYCTLSVFTWGLVIAAAGFLGVLLSSDLTVTYACVFFTGLGLGNVVPIVFSQAGRLPGTDPAKAITLVSVAGYLGYLGSPPLVGFISDMAGLKTALMILVPSMVVIYLIGARYVK